MVSRVTTRTTGVPGRCVASARNQHVVVDLPAFHGGPNEAMTPGEAFLAGVASCGVLLVEHYGREAALPLRAVTASIEGVRKKSDPSSFVYVNLKLELTGVDEGRARGLVEKFKEH